MECKAGYAGNGKKITPNMTIKEKVWYKFIPLGLTNDEIIESWYIGNKKKLYGPSRKGYEYRVDTEDANTENVINIRYEKRLAAKPILKFDIA
ncbi:MAG: hypothetical protein ACTTKH_01205 [Treponema sp.]